MLYLQKFILHVTKGSNEVDVPCGVQGNCTVMVAIQEGTPEGRAQPITRFTDIDTARLLDIVGFREICGWPRDCTI